MAEAVVDGNAFLRTQLKRESAGATVKGVSSERNSFERYGHAQSSILQAQAAGIEGQHARILSEKERSEKLTTVRDRLSLLGRLRNT